MTFRGASKLAGRRRWLRRAALAVLVYAIVGFLILPPILRAVATRQLSRLLHREVSIQQVRLNPFALSGTIRGFLIQDLDGEPLLAWDEAYANLQLASFLGRPWVFREITTTNPYVRIQLNPDFTLNFSDLVAQFSTNVNPAATRPVALRVDALRIRGARASLTDRTLRRPFTRVIGPVELNLENFHTDPDRQNPYAFAGTTDGGETFAWQGHFSLDPIRSEGELHVGNVSLPRFTPLFQDLLRFEVRDGTVDLAAQYRFVKSSATNVITVTNASCRLTNLRVADPARDGDVVALAVAAVTNLSVDLGARRGEVESVFARDAQLTVRRDAAARINLLELAQPAPDAPTAPGSVMLLLQSVTNAFATFFASTNHWVATVQRVDVAGCALTLEDDAPERPVRLHLDDVALTARNLSNLPGTNLTAELSLRWNTNGAVKTTLAATLAPPAAQVQLSVNDLTLAPLDPYLTDYVNLFVRDSRLTVAASAELSLLPDGQPQVKLQGDARLDDFHTVDGVQADELLRWDSVRLSQLTAQLHPPEISLARLEVLGLAARVAVETNQAINVLTALRLDLTNSPAPTAPSTSAARKLSLAELKREFFGALADTATSTNLGPLGALPKLTLQQISISNAAVQFVDLSQPTAVRFAVSEVSGEIAGLSTTDLRRGDLALTGQVERGGKFQLQGALNLLNPAEPTRLQLSVQDVNLTPASPYAGRFLGYELSRGSVGLEVKYDLTGRHLKGANLIALDQFTLGRPVASPDAVNLPIKLGLALLKDRSGRIELDVPIEGDLGDPEFRLGRVIWRVIGNLIVKAATSPFAALGALLGDDAAEASFVDFPPGSSVLPTNSISKLTALGKALYERPALELELEGGFSPTSDREALARQKLVQRFRELKWQSLRQAAREQTSPAQLTLSADEYAGFLRAAHATAAANGSLTTELPTSVTNSPATARPLGGKGASDLVSGVTLGDAGLGLAQMERQLLATLPVAELELQRLATARGEQVRAFLTTTGNVTAARIALAGDLTTSTNRLARVELRLK
jgi:hypothetical protein